MTTRGPTQSFYRRWMDLREDRGPFCLNLDPTPALLREWNLGEGPEGLRRFCERVLEAAGAQLSVIKPQSAYFERFGATGIAVLEDTIRAIQARGSLALLDAKRGDIGSTNLGYADGLIGPGSPLAADAVTVHAYLGFDALAPLLDRARSTGCGVFPVVLSSNPEGRMLQDARLPSGVSVAEALADQITGYNQKSCDEPVGTVGAVVGVTAEAAPRIVARLPQSLILAPGLGAQGGTLGDVAARFEKARLRVLPCSGREVLSHGPDRDSLAQAISEHCAEAHRTLQSKPAHA